MLEKEGKTWGRETGVVFLFFVFVFCVLLVRLVIFFFTNVIFFLAFCMFHCRCGVLSPLLFLGDTLRFLSWGFLGVIAIALSLGHASIAFVDLSWCSRCCHFLVSISRMPNTNLCVVMKGAYRDNTNPVELQEYREVVKQCTDAPRLLSTRVYVCMCLSKLKNCVYYRNVKFRGKNLLY